MLDWNAKNVKNVYFFQNNCSWIDMSDPYSPGIYNFTLNTWRIFYFLKVFLCFFTQNVTETFRAFFLLLTVNLLASFFYRYHFIFVVSNKWTETNCLICLYFGFLNLMKIWIMPFFWSICLSISLLFIFFCLLLFNCHQFVVISYSIISYTYIFFFEI